MRLLDARSPSPSRPAADTCPDCADELSLQQLLEEGIARKKKAKATANGKAKATANGKANEKTKTAHKATRWNIVKGRRHDSLSSHASLELPVKRERHSLSNAKANRKSFRRKLSNGEHNEFAVIEPFSSPLKTRAMRSKLLQHTQQPLLSAAKKASSKALRLANKVKSKAKARAATSKGQLRPVIIANAVMNSPR